jgi:hypothetical protein
METSLHRQLKELYAGRDGQCEVRLGRHRIDVVRRGRLYEIQHGSLAAIRRKIVDLVGANRLTVVKPLITHKTIVQLSRLDGAELYRRASPKHCSWLDAFEQLVYLAHVFPHPRLTLEFAQVTVEETRYPGHGRRRRRRDRDFLVADQRITELGEVRRVKSTADLWRLLGPAAPRRFDSGELAQALATPRWIAQRIAYCLLHTGAARQVGKAGNARIYERVGRVRWARAA